VGCGSYPHLQDAEVGATYARRRKCRFPAVYYGQGARVNYRRAMLTECATRRCGGHFTLSEQLTLILNYDYGTQDEGGVRRGRQVAGLAGYLNYS